MTFITIARRFGGTKDEAGREAELQFENGLRAACWISSLGLLAAITVVLCGIALE